MLRAVLGIAAGLGAGALVVAGVETAGRLIFPSPAIVSFLLPEDGGAIMRFTPLGAKIAALAALAAGALLGGALGAWIARRGAWPAWAIGGLLFAMGAWRMAMIPHPIWMWAGALIAAAGAAFLAGRLFSARTV